MWNRGLARHTFERLGVVYMFLKDTYAFLKMSSYIKNNYKTTYIVRISSTYIQNICVRNIIYKNYTRNILHTSALTYLHNTHLRCKPGWPGRPGWAGWSVDLSRLTRLQIRFTLIILPQKQTQLRIWAPPEWQSLLQYFTSLFSPLLYPPRSPLPFPSRHLLDRS